MVWCNFFPDRVRARPCSSRPSPIFSGSSSRAYLSMELGPARVWGSPRSLAGGLMVICRSPRLPLPASVAFCLARGHWCIDLEDWRLCSILACANGVFSGGWSTMFLRVVHLKQCSKFRPCLSSWWLISLVFRAFVKTMQGFGHCR